MRIRIATTVGIVALVASLNGCATRSISNSGYAGRGCYQGGDWNPFYRGELSEFDLLGVDRSDVVTEEQIGKTLDDSGQVTLRKGSAVLLIQSGAMQPDEAMTEALEKSLIVVPFSGQPGTTNTASYSKALRLAAARAGCETIICCWGALESVIKGHETKAISWVPVAGWLLPDEAQKMRIQLKVALVDVRSGRWSMFSPRTFEDRAHSALINRKASDQEQVEKLKQLAYASAVQDLVKIYAR